MAKLSDTQLIVLAAAGARDDGFAVIPAAMKAAAATKVGSGLVTRKLMREVFAKPGMPVWYADEDQRGLTLVITAAGRKAIGIEDEAEASDAVKRSKTNKKNGPPAPAADVEGRVKDSAVKPTVENVAQASDRAKALPKPGDNPRTQKPPINATRPCAFREGSKQALVVKMLSAKAGATLPALEDATGWLPHTMRAALTGLRKKGFAIARDRQPGKNSVYRIEASSASA